MVFLQMVFKTTGLPANAAANLSEVWFVGKFQGVTSPATPPLL